MRPGGNASFEALINCIRVKEIEKAYTRKRFQQQGVKKQKNRNSILCIKITVLFWCERGESNSHVG